MTWLMLSHLTLLANSVDPGQTPHYVASDLGLHFLPMTIIRVSMITRVKS